MIVHLIDGTYELFRQFFGRPGHIAPHGHDVGAMRGVLQSTLALIEQGATHLGVATDHVIESFRNELFDGYKSGDGIDPALLWQFHPLEEGLQLMGVTTWPSIKVEADDSLASAALIAQQDSRVKQVRILSPDKDLAQCVNGSAVVQVDRRKDVVFDEGAVIEKFGVLPTSIPDYLALVGDSADGYPGIAGFGAKSTATLLMQFKTIEAIPQDVSQWGAVRGAAKLSENLQANYQDALLFKELATLRTQPPVIDSVDELAWQGPTDAFSEWCERHDATAICKRATKLAEKVL